MCVCDGAQHRPVKSSSIYLFLTSVKLECNKDIHPSYELSGLGPFKIIIATLDHLIFIL